MNDWIFKNKPFKDVPEGYIGFVYLITLLTDTPLYPKGSIYVGKKIFTFKKKSRLSKRARKGTRKRVKIESIDSQWSKYFGSSLELKSLVKKIGEDKFKREILHLCKTKSEMSFMEVEEQIKYRIFHVPSFNKWISCKIYKSNFNNTKTNVKI